MTDQHRKENFSKAYVDALAAVAGVICSSPQNDYKVDGRWNGTEYDPIHHEYDETGFSIDYQLKASESANIQDEFIIYDLEAKNYRSLIKTNVGMPRILILHILPRERSWLEITPSQSTLYQGAWWISLRGYPESNNTSTVRIKIPLSQQLTPEAIVGMFDRLSKGECL